MGTGEPNQADVPQKRRRTMLVVTTLIVVPLIGLAIMAWPRDQPNDHRSASSTAAFGSSASVPASNDLDVLRTDQSQATPSSTGPATTEQESPPAVPVVPPEDPQALESLERLLAATVDAIGSPAEGVTGSLPDLSGIATGALLGELEAVRAEYEAEGWMQIGVPAIVGLEVVQAPTPSAPADAVIEVCLDNSSVRIVDREGNVVREAGSLQRVLNVYVLRFVDGGWVAADHTFPDDTAC